MQPVTIPANPGFYARWSDPDTRKTYTEPVIAWLFDEGFCGEGEKLKPVPVTTSGPCDIAETVDYFPGR